MCGAANPQGWKGTMSNQWFGKDKWQGTDISTEGTPLVDPATGQPFIIRSFEFHFDPNVLRQIKEKKIPAPTRQELFNSNLKQIRTMLWGDGLVAVEEAEFPPRIIVGKKKYKIIVTCQPRRGTIVADKPFTLQELTNPKS